MHNHYKNFSTCSRKKIFFGGGGGGSYGRAKRAWKFFAQTTTTLATFHIHKLLEVVHSMLTIAVFLIMHSADHSSIPNSLPHGNPPHKLMIIHYHRKIWGGGGGGGELECLGGLGGLGGGSWSVWGGGGLG